MTSTRNDLPQFCVESLEQGEQDDNGYIAWTLRGKLNRTLGIAVDTWCFLLLPGQGSLTGTFTLNGEPDSDASFGTDAKEKPDVIGAALAELSSYWRRQHIWMIEVALKAGPNKYSPQAMRWRIISLRRTDRVGIA